MLDSGAEGPGFKSQPRRCRVTVLGKLFTPIHQAAKLVTALLRVARVTAGLAKSSGSLPPGLYLAPPAGRLSRTGISSGTLRSVIEYGLPFYIFMVFLLMLVRVHSSLISTGHSDNRHNCSMLSADGMKLRHAFCYCAPSVWN